LHPNFLKVSHAREVREGSFLLPRPARGYSHHAVLDAAREFDSPVPETLGQFHNPVKFFCLHSNHLTFACAWCNTPARRSATSKAGAPTHQTQAPTYALHISLDLHVYIPFDASGKFVCSLCVGYGARADRKRGGACSVRVGAVCKGFQASGIPPATGNAIHDLHMEEPNSRPQRR